MGTRQGRAFRNLELVAEDPAAVDREVARLRAVAGELHRRESDLSALVGRLESEARVHEDVIASLLERLAADELELNDLRAVRDALTPPELARRPGVDLAASFLPATDGVSGDFYLVIDGPDEATAVVVGDVIGKGLEAARRAAFIRTVFATTAPFSDDPGQLLSWANTALFERAKDDRDFVTVGCVTYSPRERVLRWGYAGHPPVLWLDTAEELSGGRAPPLGLSEELACTTAEHQLTPGTGVLLYTDGVTESCKGQAPSEVVAAVTSEVHQFAATRLADDLCVVAARIGES